MSETLLQEVRNNRKNYEAKILASIKDNIYQHKRYEVPFSLAIGAMPSKKIQMQEFSSFIRETDNFIVLGEHMACAIFSFVDTKQGIKAASNLLSKFEMKFFSEKIYLSILNVEQYPDASKQINKLFSILEFSVSNKMNNIPLDEISFEVH